MTIRHPLLPLVASACLVLGAPCLCAGETSATAPAPSTPPEEKPTADPVTMSTIDVAKYFHPGETLNFRVGFGIISGAGETVIATTRIETPDGPRIRVEVNSATKGIAEMFYTLNNDSVALIDAGTGRPLSLTTTGKDGKRKTDEETVFDYKAGTVVFTDKSRPGRSGSAELPDRPVFDLTVTMLGARSWGMKVGDTKEIIAAFGSDFYKLEITAIREDTIKTPAGKFDVIVLEPKQLGEQMGIFKKGGGFKFYISKGDNPQIVRIDIKVNFGTFVAVLTSVKQEPEPAPGKE